MARFGAAMMTVNRWPKPNYIRATFEYMKLGGVFDFPEVRFVIAESGSEDASYLDFLEDDDVLRERVEIIRSPKRISLNRNFVRSLRLGAGISDEYVMLLEDDIEVCDRFMERVDTFLEKHGGEGVLWTFHQSYQEIVERYRDGFDYWNMEAESFYGTLCIVIEKATA